jgi:hypothetical protein
MMRESRWSKSWWMTSPRGGRFNSRRWKGMPRGLQVHLLPKRKSNLVLIKLQSLRELLVIWQLLLVICKLTAIILNLHLSWLNPRTQFKLWPHVLLLVGSIATSSIQKVSMISQELLHRQQTSFTNTSLLISNRVPLRSRWVHPKEEEEEQWLNQSSMWASLSGKGNLSGDRSHLITQRSSMILKSTSRLNMKSSFTRWRSRMLNRLRRQGGK